MEDEQQPQPTTPPEKRNLKLPCTANCGCFIELELVRTPLGWAGGIKQVADKGWVSVVAGTGPTARNFGFCNLLCVGYWVMSMADDAGYFESNRIGHHDHMNAEVIEEDIGPVTLSPELDKLLKDILEDLNEKGDEHGG